MQPDIVVFQEATRPAVIEGLAKRSGMTVCAALPRLSLGFMSRIPIAHYEWHRPRVSRHAFLEIVPEGMEFRVFGVHLSAVFAAWTERRRVFELRAMLNSIKRHQHGFHALVGDFNTVTPGELLDFAALPQKVRATVWLSGGTIRWRTTQVVKDAGYADAFRVLHPADPGLTLPAVDAAGPPRLPVRAGRAVRPRRQLRGRAIGGRGEGVRPSAAPVRAAGVSWRADGFGPGRRADPD